MAALSLTAREFRNQQAHVFDLAEKGKRVLIRRRNQYFTIVPVGVDDLRITPELQTEMDKAREECRKGETLHLDGLDELHSWLNSL